MGATLSRTASCLAIAGALLFLPATEAQKKTKKVKAPETRVENYFGGVFLVGDGGIPDGPCFRIRGRVTSGEFFNTLKSFEGDDGVIFRSGTEEVTEFPSKVILGITIHDQPCETGLQAAGAGTYLTREEMSSLKLTLYWKHGVDLRPVESVAVLSTSVDPIEPYAKNLEAELPKRYVWSYELGVPSEGVPLMDSLVLVFQTAAGHIAARVAARL